MIMTCLSSLCDDAQYLTAVPVGSVRVEVPWESSGIDCFSGSIVDDG